jgi:hypothetical protein
MSSNRARPRIPKAPVKALSIRPHWAYAILHFGKDIENRSWTTSYRGPLLIHAGQKLTRAELEHLQEIAEEDGQPVPERDDVLAGGIVGQVVLVDVVTRSRSPWFGGQYGWVLARQRRLRFVPLKGRLGLFDVDV